MGCTDVYMNFFVTMIIYEYVAWDRTPLKRGRPIILDKQG